MSPTNLGYRDAKKEDVPAINAFNEVGVDAWVHEFFSPSKPRSYLTMCIDGEKIVGTEGYVDYQLVLDGATRLTHRSERTLVSPDYRGQGIFPKLIARCTAHALLDDSQFCWGATAALKAFQNAGFVTHTGFRTYAMLALFPARYFTRFFLRNKSVPLNPLTLLRRLRARDLATLKEGLSFLASLSFPARLFSGSTRRRPDLRTTSAPMSPADVDDLHERIRQSPQFLYLRHSESLYRWLEEEGGNKFIHVYTYEENTLRSYLCVDVGRGQSFATVVDFCSESEEFLAASLEALKESLAKTGHATLMFGINTANLEQHRFLAQLKKLGGTTAGTAGSFVVQPLALTKSPLYDSMQSWYLTDIWLSLGAFTA